MRRRARRADTLCISPGRLPSNLRGATVGSNEETTTTAQIHWLNQVSANFNTAADWSTGTVPGASDDVFLDAAGSTDYTVTASTSETVHSIKLANPATLAISGGVFTASSVSSNAGTIAIGNGSTFACFNDQIVNTGTIALASTGAATTLDVSFDDARFDGGGTISLSGSAENTIEGPRRGFITNVDNTIVGSGSVIGLGRGTAIINEAGGVIDADSKTPLFLKLSKINNAGLIETTGKGHCMIAGVLENTGTLEANGGLITLKYGAGGSGSVIISAGAINSQDDFNQDVSFTGRSGKLELAKSQSYSASIAGFSLTGRTSLDLRDIAFVNSGEATFTGTATSGVLTVTDGTHTAHINLIGDYTGATFVTSADNHGSAMVIATGPSPTADAHRFIAAAAGLPHAMIA